MSMKEITKPEFMLVLTRPIVAEFREGAALLRRAAEESSDLQIRMSSRAVPSSELYPIYRGRRDWVARQGKAISGLREFVELLERSPSSTWELISVSDSVGPIGAVFVAVDSGSIGIICFWASAR